MLKFHLIGNWPRGCVQCSIVSSTFQPADPIKKRIEESWAAAKMRLGDKLFDGPMCRLESSAIRDGVLQLNLSRTSYKPFLGTNLTGAHLADQVGSAAMANPVGMSCALISAEGFLMMGQRNDLVAYYPSRVHPFAGALEPHEPIDVFAEVQRELAEELSLNEQDITDIRCVALVEDLALRQPELIFLVRCALPDQQIAAQLDAGEHVATFVVEPDPAAAQAALVNRSLLTPVGAATLLVWGRYTFGNDWFESAYSGFTPAPPPR